MLRLNEQQIADFQKLYLTHYGVELSSEDAYKKGIQLCRLVEIALFEEDDAVINQDNEPDYPSPS